MQTYVNHYTRGEGRVGVAAIGILLCAEKNHVVVRYTLPEGERQIFASRLSAILPSEDDRAAELSRERELRALRGKIVSGEEP